MRPLRDAANGVVHDLVEAAYKAGFRDGVVCTLLAVIVVILILGYLKGQKQ